MKIVHAEINKDLKEETKTFYEKVFQWKFDSVKEYKNYYKIDSSSSDFTSSLMYNNKLKQSIILTILVESIDETLKQIAAFGGETIGEIIRIPEYGNFVYINDPDGTVFCLKEEDL
jgi:uncharacterized protein